MELCDCTEHQVFQAITTPGSAEVISFTSWLRQQRNYNTLVGLATVSKNGVILSCAMRFSDWEAEGIWDDAGWSCDLFRAYISHCRAIGRKSGFDLLQELS